MRDSRWTKSQQVKFVHSCLTMNCHNKGRDITIIFRTGQRASKRILCPTAKDKFHPGVQAVLVWWADLNFLTWFFPFSMSRLVTFPKGRPRPITSASFMSLGSLRTWTTRDGTPGLRTSPLNFLLSLPLAARENRGRYDQGGNRRLCCLLNNGSIVMATQNTDTTSTSIKKDSLLHGNPPTWVHDIRPVGYAGRKQFVGSPLQMKERKQWFTSVHSPMRTQHGRWKAQRSYYKAIVW